MITLAEYKCLDSWLNQSKFNESTYVASEQANKEVFSLIANTAVIKFEVELIDSNSENELLFVVDSNNVYRFKPYHRAKQYSFEFKFDIYTKHNFKIYGAQNIKKFHARGQVTYFATSAQENNTLELLDLHENQISQLQIKCFKQLNRLHIFSNPIVDDKHNLPYLEQVMRDLPDREGKPLGSIILYPWYGLETLIFFADGTHPTKSAALTIGKNTTGTTTAALINSAAKVAKNTICKYPPRLHFRGNIKPLGLNKKQREEFYYDDVLPEIKANPQKPAESILYAFSVMNQCALSLRENISGSGYRHNLKLCARLNTDDSTCVFDSANATVKFSTVENLKVGDNIELVNGDSGETVQCKVLGISEINNSVTLNYTFNTIRYNTKWFAFNLDFTSFGDIKFDTSDRSMFHLFAPQPQERGLIYATYLFDEKVWKLHPLTDYNYLRVYLEDRFTTRRNWFFGSAIQYSPEDYKKCFHWFTDFGAQDIWETAQKGFGQTIGIYDTIGGLIDGDYANSNVWQWSANFLRLQNAKGDFAEPQPYTHNNWINSNWGHGDCCFSLGLSRGNFQYGIVPNACGYAVDDTRGAFNWRGVGPTGGLGLAAVYKEMNDFCTLTSSSYVFYQVVAGAQSNLRYVTSKSGQRIPILQAAGNDGDDTPYTYDTSCSNGGNNKPYTMNRYYMGSTANMRGRYGMNTDRDDTDPYNFENLDNESNNMFVHAMSRDYIPSSFTQTACDANLMNASYKQYLCGFGDMAIMYRASSLGYGKFNGTSCATPATTMSLALLKNLFLRIYPGYGGGFGMGSVFMDYVRRHLVNPLFNLPSIASGAGAPNIYYGETHEQPKNTEVNFEVKNTDIIAEVGDVIDFGVNTSQYRTNRAFYNHPTDKDRIIHDYRITAFNEETGETVAITDTTNIASAVTIPVNDLSSRFTNITTNEDDLSACNTRLVNYNCNKAPSTKSFDIVQDDSFIDSETIQDASDVLYEYSTGILGLKDVAYADCDELTLQVALNVKSRTTDAILAPILFLESDTEYVRPYDITFTDYSHGGKTIFLPHASYKYYKPRDPEIWDWYKTNIPSGTKVSPYTCASETIQYGFRTHYYPISGTNPNSAYIPKDSFKVYDFVLVDQTNIVTMVFKNNEVTYYMNGNKIRVFQTHKNVKLGQLAIDISFLDKTLEYSTLVYPRKLNQSEIIQNTIAMLNTPKQSN